MTDEQAKTFLKILIRAAYGSEVEIERSKENERNHVEV